MNRCYKYRLYPTPDQEEYFQKCFRCARFVYNAVLEKQNELYQNGGSFMTRFDANNYCNHVLKEQYPFLKEVDKFVLTNSIWALDVAFRSFFNHRTNYPRFKSRDRCRKAYTTNYVNNNIEVSENAIKLPKIKWVKAKVHRLAPNHWVLKQATISQDSVGDYYCSIMFDCGDSDLHPALSRELVLGLDYKSDGFFVSSEGEVCGSPQFFKQSEQVLAKEQKKLARMQKGSSNYEKQKKKVAKRMRHIANQRRDFSHKKANELAEAWDYIFAEDLDLKEMASRAGKKTMDNGYREFLEILQYKMEDKGKVFAKVDMYYPSSQLCSSCGYKNPQVRNLNLRRWTCPNCGTTHDRDINAAINIRDEGLRLIDEQQLQSAG